MRFTKFTIANFRGIKSTTLDLTKTPTNSISTLVGLNESGKTTILEAINNFRSNPDLKRSDPNLKTRSSLDYQAMLPISERALFNGNVSIKSSLSMDSKDVASLEASLKEIFSWTEVKFPSEFTIDQKIHFENSQFKNIANSWSINFQGRKRKGKTVFKTLEGDEWRMAVRLVEELLPKVMYFPSSLLEFPDQIILEKKPVEKEEKKSTAVSKNSFYYDVLNDVLKSIDNNLNIEKHLITRAKSTSKIDKENLEALIQKIENNLNKTILGAWKEVLSADLGEKRFRFNIYKNESGEITAQIKLSDESGIFSLKERSAGFRWFFAFIMLVTYRTHRNDRVLFLFDEPAANLHPRAQAKLLNSLSELSKAHQFIYTTHSHYLINPSGLESTFVVKNESHNNSPDSIDNDPSRANITITPYRSFVGSHIDQHFYYKPIMDALDYAPTQIAPETASVLIEGKTDFYCLEYFNKIILKKQSSLTLFPGGGSGGLDALISLLIGWGTEFSVVLDGDASGEKERLRYIEKFESAIENRITTLSDLRNTKEKTLIENLFDKSDIELIRATFFPEERKLSKKLLHKAIQELLAARRSLEFSTKTIENFRTVLDGMNNHHELTRLA